MNIQEPIRRIVLIGFRGVGKSTLARELVEPLGWKLEQTDALVEKEHGMSIAEIVSRYGWERFRAAEHEQVQRLADSVDTVIDCGGGIPECSENMNLLQPASCIVWLDAALRDILHRAKQGSARPLLSEADWESDLRRHYERRKEVYRRYAHLRLDTSSRSIERCIEDVLGFIAMKQQHRQPAS